MIKLGETSLLQLPIDLLRKIKFIGEYYPDSGRHCDAYEHFHTGFIITLVIAWLMFIWKPAFFLILPAMFFHIFWKEVLHDKPKRESGVLHEIQAFHVDLTLRTMGFVFGAPFIIISLIW